jgi:hypothetical protein
VEQPDVVIDLLDLRRLQRRDSPQRLVNPARRVGLASRIQSCVCLNWGSGDLRRTTRQGPDDQDHGEGG